MSAPSTTNTLVPATGASAAASASVSVSTQPSAPSPSPQTLMQAAKLAMQQDKAIQLDYYLDTAQGRAFLGEDTENNEKMLVKSGEEFTSLIQKIYKVQTDFIILTENSIYIVSGNIQKRRIKAPAMRAGSSEF
jgi:hypothetical protein